MRLRDVLLLGLIVRVAIAPFFAHPFDVYSWYTVGESVLNGKQPLSGFLVPYNYAFFIFVFPATLAFNFLSGYLGSYTIPMSSLNPALNPGAPWNITVVPGPLFDLLVKLPLIVSDLVIALLVYNLVMRYLGDERVAVSACALWFLNPLTIWVSSAWGMFDALPALFTVLGLYLALDKKFAYAGISIALAIEMKYYAVVLVFPLLLVAWEKGRWRGLAESLGATVALTLVLSAPLLSETASSYASVVGGSASSGLSYSGLSFWTAITLFVTGINFSLISDALVVALLAIAYVWMWRRSPVFDLFSASIYFGLPILVLLAAFRFVGENYFIWVLPFAAIIASRGGHYKVLFWAMSILALVSSMTDSLLPYYVLPMAPLIGHYLVGILGSVAPYRVAAGGSVTQALSLGKLYLSAIGLLATAILALTAHEWIEGLGNPGRYRVFHQDGLETLVRSIDQQAERRLKLRE